MSQGFYNDINLINAAAPPPPPPPPPLVPQQHCAESNRSVNETSLNNPPLWNNQSAPPGGGYLPQHPTSEPYYNAPVNVPFYSSQPNEQQTGGPWTNWSTEANNNPPIAYDAVAPGFHPQQHDPWQWSVGQSNEGNTHWQPVIQQPSEIPANPEPGYYYGQNQTHYPYHQERQQQIYDSSAAIDHESTENAANSWESTPNPANPTEDNINSSFSNHSYQNSPVRQIPPLSNDPEGFSPTIDRQQIINANFPTSFSTNLIPQEEFNPGALQIGNGEIGVAPGENFGQSSGKLITDNFLRINESQADEPNQEVPEPVKLNDQSSLIEPLPALIATDPLTTEQEDKPNEQVPSLAGKSTPILMRTTSPPLFPNQPETVSKSVLIQPWEGGPFQPPTPRPPSRIIQQEVTDPIDESLSSNLEKLNINRKEIVANLESEPDNLERPLDSESIKLNPHHLSLHRQQFPEELDGSTSKTSLWENPNLPNILFVPAAQSIIRPSVVDLITPIANTPVQPTLIGNTPVQATLISNPVVFKELPIATKVPEKAEIELEIKENVQAFKERLLPVIPSLNPIENEAIEQHRPLTKENSPERSNIINNERNRTEFRDERNKINSEWNERTVVDGGAAQPPGQTNRHREVEDLDRRGEHYNNNRYPKDKNDRYYYDEARERNSRPSSRASEPTPENYSRRYYNSYEPNSSRSEYFNPQNAAPPPPPPREGTPQRSGDILRTKDDYYASDKLRATKSDEYGTADMERRRSNDYGNDVHRTRPEEYASEPSRRRAPDNYSNDPNRRRAPEEYGSEPGRRRAPEEYGSEPGRRRAPEEYGSEPGRRRAPEEYGSEPGRRRAPEEYGNEGVRRRPEDYTNDPNALRERRGYEDERQPFTRGLEDDYYNRNAQAYKDGYSYDYYRQQQQQQQQDPYSMYYNYYNYNYGFYDEYYRNNPKYRQQMDQYRAYYSQMGYDSDRLSVHSGRSSVNEELRKERYPKDYDTGSEYSGYQPPSPFDTTSLIQADEQDSIVDSVASRLTPAARLTPAKFSCPHPVARLYPGKLLALLPLTSSINNCSLELHDLQQSYLLDRNYQNVKIFPGPLLSGQTHKNDVIQFCQQKIQQVQSDVHATDRDSQILLWELLVLMLRQNGNVSGSDIAELLLKDRKPIKLSVSTGRSLIIRQASAAGSSSSPSEEASELPVHLSTGVVGGNLIVNDALTPSPDEGIVVSQDSTVIGNHNASDDNLSVQQITRKFTEYLLFGNKKDALEWATKHALWGHALFLASKMDARNYANIMTRFANSLPLNDPLQTLYQLMSGRQPSAVTRVAEEKWGDWRPHLAMILSNLSSQPEVDCRSITTLGDTLAQKGCLSAAHFCYLMAQVEFGRYDNKASKLVLLTSNHTLPFLEFATTEAIQCTEIYEYAQSLANSNFFLPNLQPYKLMYTARLVEYGLLQEALHYCEVMTTLASKLPGTFSTSLLTSVSQLALKLKYQDPQYTQCQGELEDIADPEWLGTLDRLIIESTIIRPPSFQSQEALNCDPTTTTMGVAQHSSESDDWVSNSEPVNGTYNIAQTTYSSNNAAQTTDPTPLSLPVWSQNQINSAVSQPNWNTQQQPVQNNQYTSNIYSTASYGQNIEQSELGAENRDALNESVSTGYYDQSTSVAPSSSSFDYYGATTQQQVPPPSSANRERQDSAGSYGRRDSTFSSSSVASQIANSQMNRQKDKTSAPLSAQLPKKDVKNKPQAGRSWLGGIFSKLLPKGPNQMILPDDNNPSIVWDSSTNKWVNQIDDDDSKTEAAPLAPPTDSELNPMLRSSQSPIPSQGLHLPGSLSSSLSSTSPPPPLIAGVNRFQRQKHKGMRQNYVDVLNVNNSPAGMNSTNNFQPTNPCSNDNLFPKLENSLQTPQFFVPQPSANIDGPGDFVSPAHSLEATASSGDNSEMGSDPSFRMFDPAEFSTAPNITGDVGASKRPLGGYLSSRRAYPS